MLTLPKYYGFDKWALRVECKCSTPSLVRINATEVPLCCTCMCVWGRELCVFVCQATLYASWIFKNDCFKTFTLPYPWCWWVEVGNVIMMMYNLFVCINVHCEKVGRAPHCQSPLSYCTECSLVLRNKKEKEKTCLRKKVLYSDCHLGCWEK